MGMANVVSCKRRSTHTQKQPTKTNKQKRPNKQKNTVAYSLFNHIYKHWKYSTMKSCPEDSSSGHFWSNLNMKLEHRRNTDNGN